ncbi:MAG TPA: AAA-like domain-containing protein [Blastocatellia bacterium]|nr:AAA-like domain-containing protein [Blastocatellia bacterium]
MNTPHFYEFAGFRLDPHERMLSFEDAPLQLEPKVFDLLVMLIQHQGHLIEKETLMHHIWPETFVEESNLTRNISTLRRVLESVSAHHSFIETIPKHGYRFVAEVKEVRNEAASDQLLTGLAPVGGAVALDSKFYIQRATDAEFLTALKRQDSLVLVKGARQVGKTSLLARGLQQARQTGAQVIVTDFQNLSAAHLASSEKLFLTLAEAVADQLDLDVLPSQTWNPHLSPGINFERYFRRQIFPHIAAPIVWGLDEVDRLFTCPFGSEVFGLFRSWHNKRALDPDGHWNRLTLAIAYATEAHLFITDLNQSPFNVGTRLQLDDFTRAQVQTLNTRFGAPLRDDKELQRFIALVGGHPYLVHRGLAEMAAHGLTVTEIEARALRNDGLFGDHLRRVLLSLLQDSALQEAIRQMLRGARKLPTGAFYALRSAGLLTGEAPDEARLRCQLYADYLLRHLE